MRSRDFCLSSLVTLNVNRFTSLLYNIWSSRSPINEKRKSFDFQPWNIFDRSRRGLDWSRDIYFNDLISVKDRSLDVYIIVSFIPLFRTMGANVGIVTRQKYAMQYRKEQQISLYYNVVTTFRCCVRRNQFFKKKRKKRFYFPIFPRWKGKANRYIRIKTYVK